MTEVRTVSLKQLRALHALADRGSKGMRTSSRNTNSTIVFATAEALERAGYAKIVVDGGEYVVAVTDEGARYSELMRSKGHR